MTIAGGGNGYNAQIATATPNGSGSLNGEAFGGGGYFEATLSFAGSPVMNIMVGLHSGPMISKIRFPPATGHPSGRAKQTGTSTRSKPISWSI